MCPAAAPHTASLLASRAAGADDGIGREEAPDRLRRQQAPQPLHSAPALRSLLRSPLSSPLSAPSPVTHLHLSPPTEL